MKIEIFKILYLVGLLIVVSVGLAVAELTADFNGDGQVNFHDFLLFAKQFGLAQGEPGFDARFDLDKSGEVDFSDFTALKRSFNTDVAAAKVAIQSMNDKPTWIGDGFQLITVFRQNAPAALLLPAATGDGPLTYNLHDIRNNDTETLTLPDGLKFDPVSRMIYGTPTTVESETYTYSVTDRHGQQKKFEFLIGVKAAPEWASLSVLPGPDVLHVVWTPTADPEATGYLVQWKSGDQEFSDTERRHTTGSDASSYKIANPAHGVEYSVKVTQIGGLHDGDHLTRRVTIGTDFVSLVTLVRGGEAKTYKARINKPTPASGAVYPKQNLDDYFAHFDWDSGEKLRPPRPVLYFFTASEPTADELAKRSSDHAPMKWDAVRAFSLQAPERSAAGSVPIYHDFIWDDDPCASVLTTCTPLKRPEFSAGVVIVHIVNPPVEEKASNSPPTGQNNSPTEGKSSPALTGLSGSAESDEQQEEGSPAVTFVIYHDPDAGSAAVNRYNQAITLLTDAGVTYSVVSGDVQADASRLAEVSNSIMPRFFLGDPTASDWVSQPKANNGGLRWLKQKVAELSD